MAVLTAVHSLPLGVPDPAYMAVLTAVHSLPLGVPDPAYMAVLTADHSLPLGVPVFQCSGTSLYHRVDGSSLPASWCSCQCCGDPASDYDCGVPAPAYMAVLTAVHSLHLGVPAAAYGRIDGSSLPASWCSCISL